MTSRIHHRRIVRSGDHLIGIGHYRPGYSSTAHGLSHLPIRPQAVFPSPVVHLFRHGRLMIWRPLREVKLLPGVVQAITRRRMPHRRVMLQLVMWSSGVEGFYARHGGRVRILVHVRLVLLTGGRTARIARRFRFWYQEVVPSGHAAAAGSGYFGFGNLYLSVGLYGLEFCVVWVVLRFGFAGGCYGTVADEIAGFDVFGVGNGGFGLFVA